MGTSKNEEEKWRSLDKRTLAQGASEKKQEKWQMERILKKHSKPTSREQKTSTDAWTRSRSTMTFLKLAEQSSLPIRGTE
ncbi:hypothetical protein E2I00_012331 [Balaenoptera physalus]|uniref:Uncharacterized protein n=1 Tax=Balaenoptera physalus TaxID=9770 RepID=A0A643AT04_BALPH|nr:hypothetical protein E2I00_012331 [Balaenoptera physalus]